MVEHPGPIQASVSLKESTPGRIRTAVLICAVVAFGQFAVSLGHGFVLDDASSVMGAVHTTGGIQLPLFEPTLNGQGRFYRPFGYLGFSVDYALYGDESWGFHLTCVLLHTAATALFAMLACLLIGFGPALIAGVLFAVHPVHVEAVANIWNRTGVQSAVFVFLALLAWLKIERVWLRVAIVNICAFIAVGSKEGAIALPVVLVAVVWLKDSAGRLDVRPAIACAPAFTLWLLLRHNALGSQPTFGELFTDQAFSVKLFTLGEILAHNFRLLIFPLTMRADYSEPTTSYLQSPTSLSMAGWCLAVGFLAALVVAIRRRHWSALGLGFMVATIWPFLHIVIPLGLPIAERWLYLPSAGFCLLAGRALWTLRHAVKPSIYRAAVLMVLVAFSLLNLQRTMEWRTPLMLWEADAAKPEASAFTWGNYGLSLWEEGHHSDALKAMMHARNLKPGWTAYDVKYREMRSKLRVVPSSIEHESNDAD